MLRFVLTICLGIYSITCFSQIESELVDSRDGKSYPTVILNYESETGDAITKEWLAKNMDFARTNGFWYKSEPAYCEVFGKLYTWEVSANVCPNGPNRQRLRKG